MKKFAALGAAAVVAISATAALTASADAKPYWPHPPFPMHHQMHPHNGFFFGFSFGPQYAPGPYPYRYAGNLHVQWCASHYRTYNPYTNTYFKKKGVPAVCVSPYSGNW
jgi:hypothetical protein